ncbi:DUF4240 domain-containing protein [Dactylosporangium sp. NBC_01737]|uniref:DUF4240 domain-containing protein n=1 Tax=Dactylosporangium sp. NBC_01737 TaxID=2975959 RepID=UPI002E13635C|nr:DUF4240 domain-containing protein [Dactylosporangium sp. NBC_01737]
MTTTGERWWELVDRARREAGAGDPEARAALLTDWLSRLDVDEIVAFDRFFLERVNEAYRIELWEVAYIMCDGCSDDGFDYFLGWLVSEGRQRYAAALADPRAAAEGVDPDGPVWCEGMWGVASRAFAAKTGESGDVYYQQHAPVVPRSDIGEPFDEDTLEERYPEVAARFC